MNTSWKLQDAKAKFSQVVEDALKVGPQYVTRRGREAVVILSVKEYERITSKKPTLKKFLLSCPKMDDDFRFERQKDYPIKNLSHRFNNCGKLGKHSRQS